MQKPALRALVIMTPERRDALMQQLEGFTIEVITAATIQEARLLLDRGPNVNVVLTESTLPDGNWADALEEVVRSGVRAGVVVCSRFDDFSLWLEALERGCQDVLAEPYSKEEVVRAVTAASSKEAGEVPGRAALAARAS
jgi:DNA-binding NtrC family response regulator